MTRCFALWCLLLSLSACVPKNTGTAKATKPSPVVEAKRDQAPTVDQIIARSKLPPPMAKALSGDSMGTTIHRLSNGMTVYISTDRQEPRIEAWIAVRAGSRHDPANSTGLAHYLEHMLFKGSSRLGTTNFAAEKPHLEAIKRMYAELRTVSDPEARERILARIDAETQQSARLAVPNELSALYKAMGARVNAFTSSDSTVYTTDMPANRLEAWAAIEADRFANPQFRLFYPELETVYEEKNRSLDRPQRRVYEAMTLALFPKHPYGTQPNLGHAEHLKTPAYGDMIDFFERWYVPNNMAIILAGDVDARRALPILEKAFSVLEPKMLPAPSPTALPPIRRRKQVDVTAEGENAIQLAWQTVAKNHPDLPALEVLDLLVDNRSAGLLNVDLVLGQKIPRGGSYPRPYNEAGYWAIHGTARQGQSLAEVEQLLLGVVEKLKQGRFSQADIDAVVLNAEIRDKLALESNETRAQRMADAFTAFTPWREVVERTAKKRAVKRADVMRAAKHYLGPDYVAVRRLKGTFTPPKIAKPKITPIKIDPQRRSAFAEAIRRLPVKEIAPEWLVEGQHYKRLALAGGPLIAVKNERNDLFTLSYRFETGVRRQRLLRLAFEVANKGGAGSLSAPALQKKLYAMGTRVKFDCGPDYTTISLTGIDRYLEASVKLVDDWLRQPAFDSQIVVRQVDNKISTRKDSLQEPRHVAAALNAFALEDKRSFYLIVPSNRELKAATSARGIKRLKKLLARLLDHKHRTTYFGPRVAADAAQVVGLGRNHRPLRPRPRLVARRSKRPMIFFVDKKAAQAQVRLIYAREPLPIKKHPLSRLYSRYIGGMSGALFQEIREARGLAYSAWGYHDYGRRPDDDAILLASLGTQPDKTVEATTAMMTLLSKLRVDSQQFSTAKRSLDQRYRSSRVSPRSAGDWIAAWDDMGYSADPRPRQWSAIKAATLDELQAFAGPLAAGPAIVAVVGDSSRIDLKGLARIGKVIKLAPERLVNY